MPVSRLAAPDHWPTLGWVAIDWIEEYLCHGPGDVQGEPIVLDDEWCSILLDVYRLHPRSSSRAGRRSVRRAVVSRAKGRAKSELAGMVVCFDSLGPSRFDGWDARGEPVGRPITAPFARCLATEEEQSGNTYDNVRVMLEFVAEHHGDEFSVDPGLTRTFLGGGGEIVPSSAASASKDGGKETIAVFDEPHLYVTPELRRMHRTVSRNLAKRKIAEPWAFETTTMFEPGELSVFETAFDYAEKCLAGVESDAGLYFNHREGYPVRQWSNDAEIRRSLAEAYGPAAEWTDFDQKLKDIRDPEATEADSRRYWLNQKAPTSGQWMDPGTWRRRSRPEVRMPKGEMVTVGFHGSQTLTATALVICRIDGAHLDTVPVSGKPDERSIWEKPERATQWEVDRSEVDATFRAVMDDFHVVRAYVDPSMWQEELATWMTDFDGRVFGWWTHRRLAMAHALERLHTAATAKESDLSHGGDGDDLLAIHIGNARKHVTSSGVLIQQPVRGGTRQIAGAVAATLAFEARSDAITAGLPKAPSPPPAPVLAAPPGVRRSETADLSTLSF